MAESGDNIPSPLLKNGRYENPFPTWKGLPTGTALLRFAAEKNLQNIPSGEELNKTLPLVKPSLPRIAPKTGLQATWLGHATVLLQIDGFTILTDPIWSLRCSPISFMGPTRYRPPPLPLTELPPPDVVLISHNHYDHLDKHTIKQLLANFDGKNGHSITWLVPDGLKQWMNSIGCKQVHEMNWGQELTVESNTTGAVAQVVFVPAQHWSTRNGIFDRNKSLWGGYAFLGATRRFFFAGDTGYCPAFEAIDRKYGVFDLAAIPIGCYNPRWFMADQHVDPKEAVMIHKDVRAKKSLGIHWGTYKMGSTEFYLEPKTLLIQAVSEAGLLADSFVTVDHGASLHI